MQNELLKNCKELLKAINDNTDYFFVKNLADDFLGIKIQYIADELENLNNIINKF